MFYVTVKYAVSFASLFLGSKTQLGLTQRGDQTAAVAQRPPGGQGSFFSRSHERTLSWRLYTVWHCVTPSTFDLKTEGFKWHLADSLQKLNFPSAFVDLFISVCASCEWVQAWFPQNCLSSCCELCAVVLTGFYYAEFFVLDAQTFSSLICLLFSRVETLFGNFMGQTD